MSTPGVDVGAASASHPRGPARLTSQHILDGGRVGPLPTTWPLGHPRGAPNPVPAAFWSGPRQPLQACASMDSLKGCWTCGAVIIRRSGPDTRSDAASSQARATEDPASPRARNLAMLDRIDAELHAGRPVVVSLATSEERPRAADPHGGCWLYIVARNYWPDGTVYYLGQDESAAHGWDLRLYVHERDLCLIKPGPKTVRYRVDMERIVTGIATARD